MTDVTAPDVYLTWNDSTRSRSLARLLGCERVLFVRSLEGGIVRHLAGGLVSALYLTRRRPRDVWYQYSFVLGVVLALYRLLRRRKVHLVADVHTKALRRSGAWPIQRVIGLAKRWTLRACRGVVVSNAGNAEYALERFGVSALILPDPMPLAPPAAGGPPPPDAADVVFVCSFAPDEPLELIAETAERMRGGTSFAVTGDPRLLPAGVRHRLSHGARLTGYLAETDYWALLRAARCVVVLSSEPACLPCGAYEAMALGHRPVVADDPHARATFGEAAIYAPLELHGLHRAIETAVATPAGPDRAGSYARQWTERWTAVRDALTRTALAMPCIWVL